MQPRASKKARLPSLFEDGPGDPQIKSDAQQPLALNPFVSSDHHNSLAALGAEPLASCLTRAALGAHLRQPVVSAHWARDKLRQSSSGEYTCADAAVGAHAVAPTQKLPLALTCNGHTPFRSRWAH